MLLPGARRAQRAPAAIAELGIAHGGSAYAGAAGFYRYPMGLAPGLRASVFAVVGEADTAIEMGSGDVPVLTEVAGRRLVFSFIVRHSPPPSGDETGRRDGSADGEDLVVGAGTLERVVVDREKFLARVQPA